MKDSDHPCARGNAGWFAGNMPGVKTIYKLKSGSYVSDDLHYGRR